PIMRQLLAPTERRPRRRHGRSLRDLSRPDPPPGRPRRGGQGALALFKLSASSHPSNLDRSRRARAEDPPRSVAFAFFPFPKGYEVSCNTLWAMTDFTEADGATRVIPGSHRFDDRLRLDAAETIPAEMEKGSVLLYTGSLYHGAGANRSDQTRRAVNITY